MTNESILPQSTQIGQVALSVADLDAMVEFYTTVVGLERQHRDETSAVLGAGGKPLLVLEYDPNANPRESSQTGLFHTAFRVPSRSALGGALDRIETHWTLDGASDHHVSEALYLDDPEGNGVEIYRDLPTASWPRNDDGTIGIGTVPLDLDTIAAASDESTTVPAETTIGHMHLEVSSLPASRAFYVDRLGFDVKTALDSALFIAAGDYHHHLGLNTWNRRSEPTGGRGLAYFELVVPATELATVKQRLTESAIQTAESDGGVHITDPDGIECRIVADKLER